MQTTLFTRLTGTFVVAQGTSRSSGRLPLYVKFCRKKVRPIELPCSLSQGFCRPILKPFLGSSTRFAHPGGEKISINRANLQQYMGRAISYFNQDRLAEAKPILLQISERFPDFDGAPQALAALALCYYKENDCTNTIKYYQELVERYPDHKLLPEAYFHTGLCHEKNGNQNLAKKAYQKVLEFDRNGVYGTQAAKKLHK